MVRARIIQERNMNIRARASPNFFVRYGKAMGASKMYMADPIEKSRPIVVICELLSQ